MPAATARAFLPAATAAHGCGPRGAGVGAAVIQRRRRRRRPNLHLGYQLVWCAGYPLPQLPASSLARAAWQRHGVVVEGEAPAIHVRHVGRPRAVSRVQARFNAFIRTFKEHGADEDYKYMQLLQEVRAGSGSSVTRARAGACPRRCAISRSTCGADSRAWRDQLQHRRRPHVRI